MRLAGVVLGREALVLDGEAVIRALAFAARPRIGRALRFLEDAVLEQPERNTPQALRALLADWRDDDGAAR